MGAALREPDEAGWAAHRDALDQHKPFRDFEFARRMPDGVVRVLSISGDPRFGPQGAFVGYRGVGRDVTEIALARERIASLAYSDPLTGLANRTSLLPALDQAVQRARRKGSRLAVVFLDLDGFKEINDLYGHDAGDALLIELAGRLRDNLRSSDLIARLGGDEFLVVLEDVQDSAPVETVAKKLLVETVRPYSRPGAQASDHREHRHQHLPRRRGRREPAPQARRHGDVRRQAGGQELRAGSKLRRGRASENDPARDGIQTSVHTPAS